MESWENVKDFFDYIERYPNVDEEGYDGVHHGGVKGLRPDAPESAKKAYARWMELLEEYRRRGVRV